MKKVVIIIPVYNVEKYLSKCLDSVFNQTYKNIEVICVNDGSTDSSPNILSKYKEKYKNLTLINKDNGGLSSARNAGLNHINDYENNFVMFIDSDDYIVSNYVETLVTTQSINDSDIVCSNYYIDAGDGRFWEMKYIKNLINVDSFHTLLLLFDGQLQSHAQTKLFKACIWKDIRFDEDTIFMEDQALMFQIFLKTNNITLLNWSGYYFLMSNDSLCRSKMTNKKILSALRSYKKAIDFKYETFTDAQTCQIKTEAENLFSSIFLMMYCRFSKKDASKNEMVEWANIRKYTKDNKLIQKFKPKNKNENVKKMLYLYFRPLFKVTYSFFKKTN